MKDDYTSELELIHYEIFTQNNDTYSWPIKYYNYVLLQTGTAVNEEGGGG